MDSAFAFSFCLRNENHKYYKYFCCSVGWLIRFPFTLSLAKFMFLSFQHVARSFINQMEVALRSQLKLTLLHFTTCNENTSKSIKFESDKAFTYSLYKTINDLSHELQNLLELGAWELARILYIRLYQSCFIRLKYHKLIFKRTNQPYMWTGTSKHFQGPTS